MISRRYLLTAFAATRFLRAQEKISTDVNVVNVFATVRDKKGQIVRDLNKEDFELDEDGRPQIIAYFSRESDLPLTLGLILDTSPSQRRVLEQERGASYKFFEQVLREDKDQAFVIHFDSEVELLQDLTNSRKQLQTALRDLEAAPPRQLNRRDNPNPTPRPRGGTALYDAILLASDELMKKQTGRKALIVLSDGVDNASRTPLAEAIASCQRNNTLVYSILFSDDQAYGQQVSPWGRGGGRRGGMGRFPQQQHPDGKKIMERLAKESGGGFFEGSKKQSLDDIYRQIQEELRSQYSLGYTPDKNDGPGFRKIHLAVRQKSLIVQAREGYYAK